MAIAPDTIRARVAARIGLLSGYKQSRWVLDLFGTDSNHVMHHAFAVGLGSTRAQGAARSRRHGGTLVTTQVIIKWAHRIRADAQVADYDAALQSEQDVIESMQGVALTDIISLELNSITQRQVAPSGDWFLSSVLYDVQHFYPTA